MGYFKKKLPKPAKDGNLLADTLFVAAPEIVEKWMAKTEELGAQVEEITGKASLVIFTMFHGLRPTECRAWYVNRWTLEDWQKAWNSIKDGFVPFGHIVVTPATKDVNNNKWVTQFFPAIDKWEGSPFDAIQSRVKKSMDVVDPSSQKSTPSREATFERMPDSPELAELRRRATEIYPSLAKKPSEEES